MVEAGEPSLYLLRRAAGGVFCWAGNIHSFMLSRANRFAGRLCRGITVRDRRERLKRSGMVDLLGMFRRRPAKARSGRIWRARVTTSPRSAISFGDMLTNPVRDAPPMGAPPRRWPGLEVPRPPQPAVGAAPTGTAAANRRRLPRPKAPRPMAPAAPRLIKRPGYLAVH